MTAFFVVVSLLFSQFALASYVCAQDALAATRMAAMEQPCEGMDADQPNLCFQFAADPSQSFEQVKVAAPSLPAVVNVIVLPSIAPLDLRNPAYGAPAELRPPPDPLFLSTLRLRV
jgi:hypothetical protein